jgi:hypothetical protein
MKFGWILLFLICMLLTACRPYSQEQVELVAPTQTAIAQAWTTTPSPTIPPTSTSTPLPTEFTSPTPISSATRKPSATPSATPPREPGRYYAPDSSYSLLAPTGWQPRDVGVEQPGLFGPSLGDFSPNLIFIQEESLFPFEFYAAMVQDSLAESLDSLKEISEDFLVTDGGQSYFRWEMESTQEGEVYRQVLYFFEAGDTKMVVTYTRPRNQGEEYDPQVDAAMKSMRFEK